MKVQNEFLLNCFNNDLIILSNEFIYKFVTYDMINQAIINNKLISLIEDIICNIKITKEYLKNKNRDII